MKTSNLGPKRLSLYTRICPRCSEKHKTTSKSHKAICEDCKRPTGGHHAKKTK